MVFCILDRAIHRRIKMMQRIRYTKGFGLCEGLLGAGPFFVPGNAKPIYVTIDTETGAYQIANHESKEITISEQAKNVNRAKKLVREHLMNLGVVFAKERRIFKK